MAYIERTDTFIAGLGFEAYRVGGSVRDELIGRKVKDADYMIRGVGLAKLGIALKDAAIRYDPANKSNVVSPLVLRDGRQAGWRVAARGMGLIEVVLPRTERPRAPAPGENVHRAFDIVVDPNLRLDEDAVRRDFTFNALYKIVDPTAGMSSLTTMSGGALVENVVDPTNCGLYDLSHKIIRTTHPDSFRDDPLRTLRALRFVSTLGYDLSSNTLDQMREHADAVNGLSANGYASGTVLEELCKLLMGDEPVKALRLALDTGVLATLLPELAPMIGFDQGSRYHDLTTDEHTFAALTTATHVDAPLRVRMALLFHDAGKPETAWIGKDGRKHYYAQDGTASRSVASGAPMMVATEDHEVAGARIWNKTARRLNAGNGLREDVRLLIRNHMVTVDGKLKGSKVRRMRVQFGDELLADLFLHRMCDLTGKGKPNKGHIEQISRMELLRREAEKDNVPTSPRDLKINGHDVRAIGADGRKIGEILNAVLDDVVCQPTEQTMSREWQLTRAEALA
jgi:tRNA nucleotidyltransferase (CCA-adding enzyme)